MRRFLLLVLATLTLVACSTGGGKEFIEPDDVFSQECTKQCRFSRTQCRAYAQDSYKQCRREYEWREQQHALCVNQGGTFCIKPERCKPARTEHCQNQYEGCFLSCGGIIQVNQPEG